MRGKKWFILLASLALVLLANSLGATRSSFVDPESSTGNTFQAWASRQWTQTTQDDFNAGLLNGVDTSSSPGDVKLATKTNWYNTNWQYRRAITIDHTKVQDVANPSTTYANFPVLVYATGLSNIKANGADIRFTSSDGITELPREIERYSGGILYAWVKVTLTKDAGDSSNDVIYMYYGNAAAIEPAPGSTYGSQNVWNSNYKGVWHLRETSGGAGAIKDSTSNVNHGTDSGSPTFGAAGKIGNCINFDGTDDYIAVPSSASLKLGSGLTIEAWINIDVWGNWMDIVFKGGGDANNSDYQFALVTESGGGLAWDGTYAGNWRTKYFNTSQNTGTWIYVVVTHNTTTVKCYRAGSEISSQADAGAIHESDYQLAISQEGAASRGWLDGKIDEIRISNIARSADWIKTCYNNQNSPSTFCSVGGEEGLYVSSGIIASQVWDTGVPGARWDGLFWNEIVPSGTDITFKVRASDTLSGGFPDAPWVPVGGTSPVTSGLPSGRYMQWQATLTTSDTSKTPTLQEVRVYHY